MIEGTKMFSYEKKIFSRTAGISPIDMIMPECVLYAKTFEIPGRLSERKIGITID